MLRSMWEPHPLPALPPGYPIGLAERGPGALSPSNLFYALPSGQMRFSRRNYAHCYQKKNGLGEIIELFSGGGANSELGWNYCVVCWNLESVKKFQ